MKLNEICFGNDHYPSSWNVDAGDDLCVMASEIETAMVSEIANVKMGIEIVNAAVIMMVTPSENVARTAFAICLPPVSYAMPCRHHGLENDVGVFVKPVNASETDFSVAHV